jgi:hypothetical protein
MRLDQVSPRVYANCDGETGGNVAIILMEDSVAAVDAARATQEEAVSHDGYPGFYGSRGTGESAPYATGIASGE